MTTDAKTEADVVARRRAGETFPAIGTSYGHSGPWAWAIVHRIAPELCGRRGADGTTTPVDRTPRAPREPAPPPEPRAAITSRGGSGITHVLPDFHGAWAMFSHPTGHTCEQCPAEKGGKG